MSFTAVYTLLKPIDSSLDGLTGPKILDFDGLKNSLPSFFSKEENMLLSTVKEGDYPKKEYKVLDGFETYEEKDHRFTVERFGIPYNREKYLNVWSEVSKHVEPFYFFHSQYENSFPSIFDVLQDRDTFFLTIGRDGDLLNMKIWLREMRMVRVRHASNVDLNDQFLEDIRSIEVLEDVEVEVEGSK